MRSSIYLIVLTFLFSISQSSFAQSNYPDLKRNKGNRMDKSGATTENKLNKNFKTNPDSYGKLKLNNRNKNYLLNKESKTAATSVLDSAIYIKDDLTKKYEVEFNAAELIAGELIQYWDENNKMWTNDTKNSRGYNAENQQVEEISEYYNISTAEWINDQRYTAVYTNDGNTENWLLENWDESNNEWDNLWRQTININTNLLTSIEEIWDDSQTSWINNYRADINYDDDGNELNFFGEGWDVSQSAWVNEWKDTTFYDAQGRIIGYKSYAWDEGEWFVLDNEEYSYNDSGELVEILILDFDFTDMEWIDYQKIILSYDDNGLFTTRYLDNLDTNYYNYRTTYQYDDSDNMIYAVNEEVDPVNDEATLITNYLNFSDLYADYEFEASELDAYYSITTNVDNSEELIFNELILEQNYPNPFNPITKIRYTVPDSDFEYSEPILLKVFDALGNEIATLVDGYHSPGNYVAEFNGRELSSGIYIYQLSSGNFIITKTMMLLK